MSPGPERATAIRSETDPAAEDSRLRGRTYAIPFERVWSGALSVAGDTRGWVVVHSDDLAGIIRCECRIPLVGAVDDLFLRVSLDENAQTRVDVVSKARDRTWDLGVHGRRIGRFVRRLDQRLGARDDQILDPTIPLSWSS